MGSKHVIPQPPPWRYSEAELLSEPLPECLTLVLWQLFRHLRDWAMTSPILRRNLFHALPREWVVLKRERARNDAPELAPLLDNLLSVTVHPLTCDPADMAESCREIAAWAEQRGSCPRTAIHFAEAAALLELASPRLANYAGRLTRNAGEYERAEMWLTRGIGLSRKSDKVECTRAHLGFAMLCRAIGRDTEASRHLNAAAILAKKDGRHWLAAEAQHDMFTHLADRGLFTLAEAHAAKALAYYPKHHERFPFFVADLAFFLVLERHFAPAVPLLTGFMRQVDNPAQHLLGLSVLVRALAGAGLVDEFQQMRLRLVGSLSSAPEYECSARINLAEAERAIGLWADAQLDAEAALALATRSNNRSDIARVEKLLSQIVAEEQDRPGDLPHFNEALAEMVKTADTRLRLWMPTRRGRPRSLSRGEWAA